MPEHAILLLFAIILTLTVSQVVATPGDYDGDRKTDVVTFRNGAWWILRSNFNSPIVQLFGANGDLCRPLISDKNKWRTK